MHTNDFLSIRDVTSVELCGLLQTTADMKQHPDRYAESLKGKALAMIFEKPSLRTRVTFDLAIHQLGGYSVVLMPAEINLGKRESIHDVAKNLERMVHGIMIRTFAHQNLLDMARFASIPVINGLTDYSHPCQALADYFTIREMKGTLHGRKLCFVGDGNNVAHSLMFGGAKLGVHVTIACPPGYEPDRNALEQAREDARNMHVTIEVTHDWSEAVKDADVIYTDTWASMGQELEADERRKVFRPFQVNKELIARAKPGVLFMHCLPAHRGEEVTDDVIDAPYSVVFSEAENRLHVQKAVLYALMKG